MESQIINLKSKISGIPKSPGIYQFLDKNAKVIYVGKAKNLKNRLLDEAVCNKEKLFVAL